MLKYEATRVIAEQVRTEALAQIRTMKEKAMKDSETEGIREVYAMIAQYREALATWPAKELDGPCKITHDELSGIATVFPHGKHGPWIDVVRPNPDLVDKNRPTDVQLLAVLFPEYVAIKDEELGYYRHYWIINRVLEDRPMWQRVFDKVKK